MKQFYCPYCNEKLSYFDGTVIKMKGVIASESCECVANFYLPGGIGKYGCIVDDHLVLKDGAKVEFRCPNPKCDHSFTSHYDDDLAEIKMMDDDGHEYVVVFNRIYGVHSTFVIDFKRKKLAGSYGEDKHGYLHDFDRPVNFFGS
ncbi:MAG: hypothetical protein ONB11_03380 [candidate division KSB1 bacterium]|nr:hypothetical protein [candidate division KSB1 bacterium]MDZ7340671.1 hypothetical protein [candidate division KSB1 bacterium]